MGYIRSTMTDGDRTTDGFSADASDTWRDRRGRDLALRFGAQIRRCGGRWSVPSATGAGGYLVDLVRSTCTCPDFATRRERCKHQHAVEYTIVWSQTTAPDGTVTETVVTRRKTYRQDWPAYNAAQVDEKEHAERLLDALCDGIPQPPQGPGRPRLPLRDVVFGIVSKVYSTMSTRRAQSDLRACRARGLVAKAPAYNTVIEHMASPEVTPILTAMIEESAAPLALIERNYVQYLGLTQAMRLAQPRFLEQFRRMLVSRLRVVFDGASHDLEAWNKTASSQVDSQLRERRRNFKRRYESLDRIQTASNELDARLDPACRQAGAGQ